MAYQLINSTNGCNLRWHEYTNLSFTPHIHENFELIYIAEGEMKINFDGRTEIAQKGDFAFILSYQIHSYETEEYSRCYMCSFATNFINHFYNLTKNHTCTKNVFIMDELSRKFIVNGLKNLEGSSIFAQKSLFYAICNEFLNSTTLVPKTDSSNELLLLKIINYISNNYTDENLTLKKLSQALGYEEHYLSRYFNTQIKMNLRDFINRYRIDYAKHLLHNSKEKISSIALECGFQTIRTFNRAFKKLTGMEPKEYKEMLNEL